MQQDRSKLWMKCSGESLVFLLGKQCRQELVDDIHIGERWEEEVRDGVVNGGRKG